MGSSTGNTWLTMSKQVPIPLKSMVKSTLHWQSFWQERRWTLCRTLHEAHVITRILNPGTVKVHELSRAIEQWEERVRSYQSRAREKISDDVRSGILAEMCPEHIKTHIHLNLTRLPYYAADRSEIETYVCPHDPAELSRPKSAGQAHFRTSDEKFGYLAKSVVFTGYEPKEFDKNTSVECDTTPINGPNHSISDFLKTRESTGLFGVPTVCETCLARFSW